MEDGLKRYFALDLIDLYIDKISKVYPKFDIKNFKKDFKKSYKQLEMVNRTILIADLLNKYLTGNYKKDIEIILKILGPENKKETGMFTTGYWIWPIAKFIEKYGVDDYDTSTNAIYEVTKRHTGEFAIRPLIIKYPKTINVINKWSKDKNVHVRRLSSEGLRPRLPWAKKLTIYIDDPTPVFLVLENLKDDESNFVQKSVANNINDYLKENPEAAFDLLKKWSMNSTPERSWIIKHALRKELKNKNKEAEKIINLI